jgi:hypothetical protein
VILLACIILWRLMTLYDIPNVIILAPGLLYWVDHSFSPQRSCPIYTSADSGFISTHEKKGFRGILISHHMVPE